MAEVIWLSEEERKRFGEYCQQEALTSDGMSKQAEKLGLVGQVMARRMKVEASAFAIVSRRLSSTESMTVETPGLPPKGSLVD